MNDLHWSFQTIPVVAALLCSDDALATILRDNQLKLEERASNLRVDVASEEYRAVFYCQTKD